MPRARSTTPSTTDPAKTREPQNGKPKAAAKVVSKPAAPKRVPRSKRQINWPWTRLTERIKRPERSSASNGRAETPQLGAKTSANAVTTPPAGTDAPSIPAPPENGKPKKEGRPKHKPLRIGFKPFIGRRRKPPSGATKEKKLKQKKAKMPKRAKALNALAFFLAFIVPVLALGRAITTNTKLETETSERRQSDAQTEAQLKQLGTSSNFPLAKARAIAASLANDCFTVPAPLPNPNREDPVSLQDKALSYDGISAGNSVNCGWDGKGRGLLQDHQTVDIPYWVHNDRATIILQLKLYQVPGSLYYYVPFVNNNGVPKISGMPAIFGTDSGAEDFMNKCGDPSDSVEIEPMRHTGQLFLDALSGKKNIDLGYLVYKNAKFGGFGPTVSSPKITEAKYCGSNDNERRFAAMVQFNGPVAGAHYTLPYGFVMVTNPQTSGEYQVKNFGPAPGYVGE
jgi:hypothetical protein